jgi:hypothetical protein
MFRSDSYEIDLTIYEADGTTPLDMSGATGLLVALYQNPDNIIAKYSLNDIAGFTTLTTPSKADLATGVIHLFYQASDNIKANANSKLYAEVVVEFNNSNFTDNKQRLSCVIEIELVQRTALHNQSTT